MVQKEKYEIDFYKIPVQFYNALINCTLLHLIRKHEKLTIF